MLDASSAMTLISFITFLGIVWWAYMKHSREDFTQAEHLPFADEPITNNDTEKSA